MACLRVCIPGRYKVSVAQRLAGDSSHRDSILDILVTLTQIGAQDREDNPSL